MSKFSKEERLCSKNEIDNLFASGKSFILYPFRITFSTFPRKSNIPCQVLIVVPKKRINGAVERNLVKRRIREAYKETKINLYNNLVARNLQMKLLILYVSNEVLDYKTLSAGIENALIKLGELSIPS